MSHAAAVLLAVAVLAGAAFALGGTRRREQQQRARTAHYRQQSAAVARAIRSGPGGPQRCRCGARYPKRATWCTNCRFWLPPTYIDPGYLSERK